MIAGACGSPHPPIPTRSGGTTGVVRVRTTPSTWWISESTVAASVARSAPSTCTRMSQSPTTAIARRTLLFVASPVSTEVMLPGRIRT